MQAINSNQVQSTFRLTKEDSEEVMHKMCVLRDTEDLQADYLLSQQDADALCDSIPRNGGEWIVSGDLLINAVKTEMADHVVVLRDIASDARRAREQGQALRIAKQAKRLEETFA